MSPELIDLAVWALPVGLMLLAALGVALLVLLRPRRDSLETVAARLGMRDSGSGKLWYLDEYEIFVEDSGPRMRLVRREEAGPLGFVLHGASALARTLGRVSEAPSGVPQGMVACSTGQATLDQFFSARFATPPVAESLLRSPEAYRLLATLLARHAATFMELKLSTGAVYCAFRRGALTKQPPLPTGDFERVLPELVLVHRALRAASIG